MAPVNTWGVNSLSNDVIQHAQSTSNTINQVAASFGTALLVSVSAAASGSATWLTGTENVFFGYHAAFVATALLSGCAVVLIVVLVRDRKPSAVAADSSAAHAVDGEFDEPTPAFVRIADKALSGLTLAEAMNPNAATIASTATMGEVIDLIDKTETTGVSVVNEQGELVGYVTDGDIMRYLSRLELNVSNPSAGVSLSVKDDEALEKRIANLASLGVMELATKQVISVDIDTPLDVACGILASKKIKKVPVTRDGVLVGALSRRNVLHNVLMSARAK